MFDLTLCGSFSHISSFANADSVLSWQQQLFCNRQKDDPRVRCVCMLITRLNHSKLNGERLNHPTSQLKICTVFCWSRLTLDFFQWLLRPTAAILSIKTPRSERRRQPYIHTHFWTFWRRGNLQMNLQAECHMWKYFFFFRLKRRQRSSHDLLQELPLSGDVSSSLASQCCVLCLSSGSLLEFEYVWRWLFTLRGVRVCWLAGIHRNSSLWYQGFHSGLSAAAARYQTEPLWFRLCTGEAWCVFFLCLSKWWMLFCVVCWSPCWGPWFWFLPNFLWCCEFGSFGPCACYSNPLLRIENRFSSETSCRLRAASSVTGLERDSASLTETERRREEWYC